MKLPPERCEPIWAAVDRARAGIDRARQAPDTEAARQALSDARFEIIDAVQLMNVAEGAARAEDRQRVWRAA